MATKKTSPHIPNLFFYAGQEISPPRISDLLLRSKKITKQYASSKRHKKTKSRR